mmetsp:Transcript_36459/g.46793  ORF Transcript_36459/g.46793 Transcript_36459/m.46793 type:complete len:188 (-) Transcript_36459:304-867(-)
MQLLGNLNLLQSTKILKLFQKNIETLKSKLSQVLNERNQWESNALSAKSASQGIKMQLLRLYKFLLCAKAMLVHESDESRNSTKSDAPDLKAHQVADVIMGELERLISKHKEISLISEDARHQIQNKNVEIEKMLKMYLYHEYERKSLEEERLNLTNSLEGLAQSLKKIREIQPTDSDINNSKDAFT